MRTEHQIVAYVFHDTADWLKVSEIHKTLKSQYDWIKPTLTWKGYPAWRRHGYHFYVFGDIGM